MTTLSSLSSTKTSSTCSLSIVPANTSPQIVLGPNLNRRGYIIYNGSSNDLYVYHSTVPEPSNVGSSKFTFKITTGSTISVDNWQGAVCFQWATVATAAEYVQLTEQTP